MTVICTPCCISPLKKEYKQDYEAEYGQKPLGEFAREIVGLDMNAAKEAFAQYLNGTRRKIQ